MNTNINGSVVLDDAGGVHSLTRVAGVTVAELRETLQDYPVRDSPDITEARQMQRESLAEVKDLERQAFAADLGVGTLERESKRA
jgi:DNA-binding transcriptional MerR regulator